MSTENPKTKPIEAKKPKTVIKRKFSPINITLALKKAKATVKKESKKNTKFRPTEKKSKDYFSDYAIVNEHSAIETMDGSIRKYLNECHPDINKFIEENEIKKLVAQCGCLTITTKNDFRVTIKTVSAHQKHVHIVDRKKNILFTGKIQVSFVKQKAA